VNPQGLTGTLGVIGRARAETNAVDTFNIYLAATGTSGDSILRLQNGTTLLTLSIRSMSPPRPAARAAICSWTAVCPRTDNLDVFYTSPRPGIIQSVATQNPDAGIVDLDYGTARFVVQYNDVEQVVIRKS